jgi:hypothetical protein
VVGVGVAGEIVVELEPRENSWRRLWNHIGEAKWRGAVGREA